MKKSSPSTSVRRSLEKLGHDTENKTLDSETTRNYSVLPGYPVAQWFTENWWRLMYELPNCASAGTRKGAGLSSLALFRIDG